MDIVKLLQDLQASLTALQSQLSDAQAAGESIAKENYDKGFADGVASVVVPEPDPEKKFTQADLDAAVQAVRDQLGGEMESLRQELSNVRAELDAARAELDSKIADAVKGALAAFKAELKAKYSEQQSKESADEAEFGKMLDEVVIEPEPQPEPEPTPEPEPVPEEPAPIEEQPAPVEEQV